MEPKFKNFPIGTRIGLTLALPIAGLLVFSFWILAGYYRAANDSGKVRSMAEVAPSSAAWCTQYRRSVAPPPAFSAP